MELGPKRNVRLPSDEELSDALRPSRASMTDRPMRSPMPDGGNGSGVEVSVMSEMRDGGTWKCGTHCFRKIFEGISAELLPRCRYPLRQVDKLHGSSSVLPNNSQFQVRFLKLLSIRLRILLRIEICTSGRTKMFFQFFLQKTGFD